MKKILVSGLIAGIVLLIGSIMGLYGTVWLFPDIAYQYFHPAFEFQSQKFLLYIFHPFIVSFTLAWFWQRFKTVLTGSFVKRGIEFGLIYTLIAVFPMMWMIYSAMNVSLALVFTWLVFGLFQGVLSGLVFEKINP